MTLPPQAAVRHRPDRQELPQRDHPRQLHLPHPRVRADGDGVLRRAGHRRGVAPVLDRRAHAVVRRPRHRRRTTCATTSTRRRSSPTTPSGPSTSSTASASRARSGASSRASPTAPTSTSRRTAKHSRSGPVLLRPGHQRALHAVRHRAGGRALAQPHGVPRRRLRRGRGAQHQGRRRQAHRAPARPAARAGQGRGAAAVAQRRPHRPRPGPSPPSCARWNVDFDDAGAIGRRYRRQDEIGTPYCLTVDFDTLEDDAVTIRERDSMRQERVGSARCRGGSRSASSGVERLPAQCP